MRSRGAWVVRNSTISRGGQGQWRERIYRAFSAHNRAYRMERRPKVAKLDHGPLAEVVTTWLESWWSPEKIANRLLIEFPHDPMMRVSHETIYQSIYVQGRGELRRELARCLRSGRTQRKAHGWLGHSGRPDPRHGAHLRTPGRGRIPRCPGTQGGGSVDRQSRSFLGRDPRGTHHRLPRPCPSP